MSEEPEEKPSPENDAGRERATPTEHSGSPFPDPRAPKPPQDVSVIPGQPMPSTDRPDDGGVAATRKGPAKGDG